MKANSYLRAVVMAVTATLSANSALALDITMPLETATTRVSDLAGYQLIQRNCMTCHSAQYVTTQPPESPRAYWEATVKKMKKPFGAQFADEDIPAMVEYLVKSYGADRSAAPITAAVVQPIPTKAAVAAASPSISEPTSAQALIGTNNCIVCHAVDKRVVGPSFKEVSAKYSGKSDSAAQVAQRIRAGSSGVWGSVPMPPFDNLSEAEASTLARYVLEQ